MLPYQQRVVEERSDLDIKISALDAFLQTDIFAGLSLIERNRLEVQLYFMRGYSGILDLRIKDF